jgi:pimeloyl-ACP methyl ester carboxylesterase
MKERPMKTLLSMACAALLIVTASLQAQNACPRIMRQDSTLNNLVDPPGSVTVQPGTLGDVLRLGDGPQDLVLIPGLGFGGEVFRSFMEGNAGRYRMYAVTLPGFDGTAPLPSPPEGTSFGEQTWTNSAVEAIEKLIAQEQLQDPVIVGHWLTGTQIALRLALKHPSHIKAVVLLAGSAKMMVTDTAYATYYGTPEKRVASIDRWLAPRWFRTVTRETWDDNNFLPGDYAVNPVLGLRLWREAATPKLHVWVRYLCEFNAQDITVGLDKLRVPTLLLKPGLEGFAESSDQNYMINFCHTSWNDAAGNQSIRMETIPDARACLWLDQPALVNGAIESFLASIGQRE